MPRSCALSFPVFRGWIEGGEEEKCEGESFHFFMVTHLIGCYSIFMYVMCVVYSSLNYALLVFFSLSFQGGISCFRNLEFWAKHTKTRSKHGDEQGRKPDFHEGVGEGEV